MSISKVTWIFEISISKHCRREHHKATLGIYRSVLAGVVHTYRAIILEFYFHHCLKNAILYLLRLVQFLNLREEPFIELLSLSRISSLVEIGLVALIG